MKLNYYTLMIDWKKDGVFSPEFGDWDRDVVEQERLDSYVGETHRIITSHEPITSKAFEDILPSRKMTKVFAVSVWSEVERTVYVRANTAKQAEDLIAECGYVEGKNDFAETIMDEGGNIGATHLDNDSDGYETYEVEERFNYRCDDLNNNCRCEKTKYSYYTEKKQGK